ncbi:MAG: hypothetical protein WB609_09340 [Candidatus Cybelea sp.]
MRRDLNNQPLLYVTNSSSVTMYSGLGGSALTLVGEIFGFQGPVGECTDAQGDVFVADGPARVVDEYAYGSIVAKNVITDTLGEPYACAIDTASGRLAVTNLTDPSGGEPGNVLVYPSPTRTPVEYSDPQMNEPVFCTFDRKGNLIVDAYDSSSHPVITELRKAGTELKTLTLSGLDPRKLYEPSGLEPAGPVMIWGDTGDVDIDQLKIAGSTATLVATLPLSNLYSIGQFITYGSGSTEVVIIPDYSGSRLQTYSYPQGTLLFTTTDGISLPAAAVISHPKAH